MKEALVVDSNDIKEILAEKFNVPEKNVIQSKYSYTVILDKEVPSEKDIKSYEPAESEGEV